MTEMLWAEMAALPPARSTALHTLHKVVETAQKNLSITVLHCMNRSTRRAASHQSVIFLLIYVDFFSFCNLQLGSAMMLACPFFWFSLECDPAPGGLTSHVGAQRHELWCPDADVPASLTAVRAKYADLLTATTTTMRSFFAQSDHLRVFHYVIDCLNMMNA